MKSIIRVNGHEEKTMAVRFDPLEYAVTLESAYGEKKEIDLDKSVIEINIYGEMPSMFIPL